MKKIVKVLTALYDIKGVTDKKGVIYKNLLKLRKIFNIDHTCYICVFFKKFILL